MTCGCTENKNLNKDKLSLESMQTLSIDEIINLYRQDYTLEESENFTGIYTLTGATPLINDVAAYWHTPSGTGAVLVLWRNTGGSGWVRIEGWGRNVSPAQEVKIGEFVGCLDPILPLGYLHQISTNTLYLYGFGKTYYCPNGATENCVYPATCSAPTFTGTYPTAKDIPFMQYDGMSPTIPPSLSVTTGESGQLIISWGASTGPTIFAYSVRVTGSDKMIFGHVPASLRNVTIGGLTNNYLYNVEVRAISTSNVVSDPAPGSGTPQLPAPALDTITTAPPSASINIGGTQPFSAACKDQYSATIQCPTLAWASGSPSVATINPTSGLATGVGVGTSNITASGGGKTSSPASVLTVNPPIVLTSISPPSAEIQINTTQQFTAKDQNTNTITTGVAWARTTGVGSIDTITGLYSAGSTAGIATISATYGGITKTASITVTVAPPTIVLTSISPASANIQINTTQQFTAKDQNTNTITTGVAWARTTGVGSIDTITGLYSAGSTAGIATISATYGGITKTAQITVTQPCTVISLVASPTSVQKGQSATLTATVTNPPNTAGYNVDFKVDGNLVVTRATNSSGVATYFLNTSSLTVATHNITASVGTPAQCTSSVVTIEVTTAPVQAGGGGVVIIAAVALVAAAMFMARKPPTLPT